MSTVQSAGGEAEHNQSVLGYAAPRPAPFVAVIWCRILAIWMFGWGLYSGAGWLGALAMVFAPHYTLEQAAGQLIAATVTTGVWLLIAWYCWRKAPDLARRMSAGAEPPETSRAMSSDELLGVIVIGIGVYLLADGLPTLAWVLTVIIENIRGTATPESLYERTMISGVIRCTLGLWMILGTGGVVEQIRKYTGRWRDEKPAQDSNPPA
jgi:hypothetical protein